VHELGYDQPKTTKELLNITTRHAFGKVVVGAIFVPGDGSSVPSSSRGVPLKAAGKGTKRSVKGNKWWPKR
jgi:hypothetical protein